MKGEFHVLQDEIDALYDLGDEPEQYLAKQTAFAEWLIVYDLKRNPPKENG